MPLLARTVDINEEVSKHEAEQAQKDGAFATALTLGAVALGKQRSWCPSSNGKRAGSRWRFSCWKASDPKPRPLR